MSDTWLTGRKKTKLLDYLPPGCRKVSVRIAESSCVGLVLSRSSVLYLPSLLRYVVGADDNDDELMLNVLRCHWDKL